MVLFVGMWVGDVNGEPRRLTRQQAAQMAVSQNLNLLARAYEPKKAAAQTEVVKRALMPTLTIQPALRRGRPVETLDTTAEYALSLKWLATTGTEVTLSADGAEDLEGEAIPRAGLRLLVKQGVLRGGATAAMYPLRRARMDLKIERARFKAAMEDLLLRVERAYWELAFAQAELEIKNRSLAQAKKQFDTTEENITRGLLAKGEIHVVEESLIAFKQQALKTKENLELAQRNLARLIDRPLGEALLAVDRLGDVIEVWPAASTPAGNPAHQVIVLQHEREAYTLSFETNLARPRLDLEASVGSNGGPQRPWTDVANTAHPEGRVGLLFEMPLGMGPDAARIQKARLEQSRRRALRAASLQSLTARAEVLQIQVRGQRERLALAERRVAIARAKLGNEREKYRNGVSTLDDLVRFQQNLDQTLIGVQRATVELRVRRAELLKVSGLLHADLGIQVQ